ncbi:DUF6573 family protein [Acinetobacter ursingii]
MNNFFAGAEVITVFSLQDALEEGVILCLFEIRTFIERY